MSRKRTTSMKVWLIEYKFITSFIVIEIGILSDIYIQIFSIQNRQNTSSSTLTWNECHDLLLDLHSWRSDFIYCHVIYCNKWIHDSHKTMADDDDQYFSYRIIMESMSKHWWYTCEHKLFQGKELRMLSDLKVKIPWVSKKQLQRKHILLGYDAV